MVKQVKKPVISKEEQKFRDELYPDIKTIKNKNILCTSCNGSLKELITRGKPRTHPFMDTLLCEKCNSFFGDGEFSVDEDGSDKYCRWCGQGGTLYLCSTCTAGFCKKCIKRNLPRAVLNEVESDDWQCFCCNVKPLYELRAHCWAANKFANEYMNNERKKNKTAGSDHTSDDSEDKTVSRRAGRTPKKSTAESERNKNKTAGSDYTSDDSEDKTVSRRAGRTPKKSTAESNKEKRRNKKKNITDSDSDCCNEKSVAPRRGRRSSGKSDTKNDEGKRKKNKKPVVSDSDSDDANEKTVSPRRAGRSRGKSSLNVKENKTPRGESRLFQPLITKMSSIIEDATSTTDLFKEKVSNCRKRKVTVNFIKDLTTAEQAYSTVETLLASMETISSQLRAVMKDYFEEWKKKAMKFKGKKDENDIEVIDIDDGDEEKLNGTGKTKKEETEKKEDYITPDESHSSAKSTEDFDLEETGEVSADKINGPSSIEKTSNDDTEQTLPIDAIDDDKTEEVKEDKSDLIDDENKEDDVIDDKNKEDDVIDDENKEESIELCDESLTKKRKLDDCDENIPDKNSESTKKLKKDSLDENNSITS